MKVKYCVYSGKGSVVEFAYRFVLFLTQHCNEMISRLGISKLVRLVLNLEIHRPGEDKVSHTSVTPRDHIISFVMNDQRHTTLAPHNEDLEF